MVSPSHVVGQNAWGVLLMIIISYYHNALHFITTIFKIQLRNKTTNLQSTITTDQPTHNVGQYACVLITNTHCSNDTNLSLYSGTWELGTPKGLWKTVLNSEVVLFLRSISMYWIGLWTEVAVLNSQVVPISQVVLKTGFTVYRNNKVTSVEHAYTSVATGVRDHKYKSWKYKCRVGHVV